METFLLNVQTQAQVLAAISKDARERSEVVNRVHFLLRSGAPPAGIYLCGPPGAGKTLVLHCVQRLLEAHNSDKCFTDELYAFIDCALVPQGGAEHLEAYIVRRLCAQLKAVVEKKTVETAADVCCKSVRQLAEHICRVSAYGKLHVLLDSVVPTALPESVAKLPETVALLSRGTMKVSLVVALRGVPDMVETKGLCIPLAPYTVDEMCDVCARLFMLYLSEKSYDGRNMPMSPLKGRVQMSPMKHTPRSALFNVPSNFSIPEFVRTVHKLFRLPVPDVRLLLKHAVHYYPLYCDILRVCQSKEDANSRFSNWFTSVNDKKRSRAMPVLKEPYNSVNRSKLGEVTFLPEEAKKLVVTGFLASYCTTSTLLGIFGASQKGGQKNKLCSRSQQKTFTLGKLFYAHSLIFGGEMTSTAKKPLLLRAVPSALMSNLRLLIDQRFFVPAQHAGKIISLSMSLESRVSRSFAVQMALSLNVPFHLDEYISK